MKNSTALLIFFVALAAAKPHPSKGLIAEPTAELWKIYKTKGKPLASLEQGLEVVLTGVKKGKMLQVKTTGPYEIPGWVKSSVIGCRITRDTDIKVKPDKEEKPAGEPLVRKGAMVKILKSKGSWIKVEASPYPIRIFKAGQTAKDPMTSEIIYTGYIVRGWIPRENCSADEKAYYDSTPQEGTLSSLVDETAIYCEKPEYESAQPDKKMKIPGKALKYCRWVELQRDGGWSRGYTDGPVMTAGWVQKDKLGPLPNTNPLNMIFMMQFKDYEIISSTDLKTLDNKKVITTLPGGTEVFKVGVDYDGCIIKTPPPIVVEGLVKCKYLRNLGYIPEKVIDNAGKQPQVTFPERGPKIRKNKKK